MTREFRPLFAGRARLLVLTLACITAACASAPPAAPPAPPPPIVPAGPTFEQKMARILRLEDRRLLRDPAPPGREDASVERVPPAATDLIMLLDDREARVRWRAALAVGRVGLSDGVVPLVRLLDDEDPEVRQMAAFGLGLIGDARARDPLMRALGDPSPLVQGSAAEGLGLIGDPAGAAPIGQMMARIVAAGVLDTSPGEEADVQRDTPVGAFRLGLFALARLKAFEPMAAAVLDPAGQPRVRWWPVAFALQRIEDPRALNALLALAQDAHPYTRAFAVKGLGALKNRAAVPVLLSIVSGGDRTAVIEAVRALGRIGDPAAAPPLLKIIQDRKADPAMRVEAVTALGSIHTAAVYDVVLDLLSDPNPDMRAAALRSGAALDPEHFVAVLSGLDPDPNWVVRAALGSVLGTLPVDIALPRLSVMLNDNDQRVVPSVMASLAKLRAPNAPAVMIQRLQADDPVVRAAAAAALAELKPAGGVQALAAAYEFGQRDTTYLARAAALAALVKYGPADAIPVLMMALSDKDWAVRVRAAALLKELDASSDVALQIRPAPTRLTADVYAAPRLGTPPVSTEIYLDTDRGVIQIELAVLDAPLTVENIVTLARSGFFNGLSVHRVVPDFVIQTGDPRGDGEGGPGYTIRDELNQRPFVRGTVGMALDWADTGGSQFFIVHSPQPQLDAKFTAFGRVIAGMDVVDAIQPRDVIRAVRVWDGITPQ